MFPGESIVPFKLDKLLKYATQFPGGLYSDSHSVIMNLDRWNKISKADQEAIEKISKEAFSAMSARPGTTTRAPALPASRPAAAKSCRQTTRW